MQLTSYGSEDIVLTGQPQITFFKLVYRRYTHFATEIIRQHFSTDLNFGVESASNIERVGDLITGMYLQIELPQVLLQKTSTTPDLTQARSQLQNIQLHHSLVVKYIDSITDIAKKIYQIAQTDNIDINSIYTLLNNDAFVDNMMRAQKSLLLYREANSDSVNIYLAAKNNIYQCDIKKAVRKIFSDDLNIRQNIITYLKYKLPVDIQLVYKPVQHQLVQAQTSLNSIISNTQKYNFAWSPEIGHTILDFVQIKIGNRVIDSHTGDWFIIYNNLTLCSNKRRGYDEMIGNIPELYTYNSVTKSPYKLIIPLQFWFCRNTGAALPMISIRYHDVVIETKLRDLSQVSQIESHSVNGANIQSNYNLNIISAVLFVDYVYLSQQERERFANTLHEYLIEILQLNYFENIDTAVYSPTLHFNHCVKYLTLFVQPQTRRKKLYHEPCQSNNYAINENHTGYPINYIDFKYNMYSRINKCTDPEFFNLVQPVVYFGADVATGINVVSYALDPRNIQPSGTMNFSRLDDVRVEIKLDPEFFSTHKKFFVGVYAQSYNILRIANGMAALAFDQ